ncbi:hypothetical protein EG68_08357 [Paragonimus skrjabini miyazakii]|uniref:Uncharacterized protein n=1 Tax=Paragonimus skrjabini miyazakii TaxID=59628 RepID=A0A8S9YQF5_9TREM|nr:hypothetical protein EG68_08357 [Paragonimus skrjabini miyazakii]
MTAHADPKSSLPSKSDSLDSNERKLNATACQLVRNVLHSLEIDSPYSSSTSSSIPTEIVEPKPTVVSVDSRGTDRPTNLIFASSASMMPTNDAAAVLSEPDEPKYSSPGSNSVDPLGISVDRKCPSHSRIFADLFPTDIFQKPEAFHSIYRSCGVGAASPNSPPIGTTVTDFQNLSSTFTNPSGFSKLSYYSTTNIPPITQVQAVSNCSPLGDGSAVKLTIPFQIADPIETLNDLNRKLEPFSQSLPSYTPSRAFMRTLNQSLIEFYPHCSTSSTCDRRSSDHLIKPDWLAGIKMETKFESVPKLALPVSPDTSKPLSNYHATRRRPPMRKRTKFETTYMSKCTRNALSWWQPLTQHPSSSPLPEPRRDVAQRIALDQRKREARVAKAIAAAERAAKADRAKMFDHVRSKARRIRRLLEPDDKEEHGFQQRCKKCKLLIPSSFPSSKFAKPQFSIPSGGNAVEECNKTTCTAFTVSAIVSPAKSGTFSCLDTESETIDDYSDLESRWQACASFKPNPAQQTLSSNSVTPTPMNDSKHAIFTDSCAVTIPVSTYSTPEDFSNKFDELQLSKELLTETFVLPTKCGQFSNESSDCFLKPDCTVQNKCKSDNLATRTKDGHVRTIDNPAQLSSTGTDAVVSSALYCEPLDQSNRPDNWAYITNPGYHTKSECENQVKMHKSTDNVLLLQALGSADLQRLLLTVDEEDEFPEEQGEYETVQLATRKSVENVRVLQNAAVRRSPKFTYSDCWNDVNKQSNIPTKLNKWEKTRSLESFPSMDNYLMSEQTKHTSLKSKRLTDILNKYRFPLEQLLIAIKSRLKFNNQPVVTGLNSNQFRLNKSLTSIPLVKSTLKWQPNHRNKFSTIEEPFGAADNWPSQPESRWETAVQTTNRMHDPNNYRPKPRSVSTPKLYNTPTCPKNIDRQYGSYVDLNNKNRTSDSTATRELRHRSRVRSVPRLCDMSVRSTSRFIGKENSGDIDARNEFRSPYRNESIKFQSPSTLTRLRKRCESVERELTSLAGIKQGYHTSTLNLPTSDCRIDALSAANQVLRRRLNELQSVQQEREKALRKARTMVDELLMKQQKIQAELMRKKSECYNPAHPSTWSLCSSPSEPELQATVPHTDSTSTEITTPDPVDHHHLHDRFKHTTFQEGVCTPNDYTGPYRLTKDQHWAEQMRKMNHRANCTQVLLKQLQEDYKKLSNNVTRIERNAKRTAHAVQSLMERSHFKGEPTSVVRYSDYSPTRPKHPNHISNAKSVVDPFVESRLQKARHTLDFLMSEPVRSNCCFSTSTGSRYGCERVKKGNLTYRTDSNPRQCSTLWKSFEQS